MHTQKLFDILRNKRQEVVGSYDAVIKGLAIDSRLVDDGYVFFAIKGEVVDGHDYIVSAIRKGAKVIICSTLPLDIEKDVCYVKVEDVASIVGYVAHQFYANDCEGAKIIGVTGTNGKSTVVTLLYQLFTKLGYKCGLISTVDIRIGDHVEAATHTTPDPITLAKLIFEMNEAGCSYIFMEVSSHGVVQGRVNGVPFSIGVFTNISRDHLDYHKTMQAYIQAKKGFFDQLDDEAVAIINKDDRNGSVMVQNTNAKVRSYGIRSVVDYHARIIANTVDGLQLKLNGKEVFCRLMGEFNAYNIAAAYGVAVSLHENEDDVLTALSILEGAPGRMDKVSGRLKTGIVDYAHTPDALVNVLQTLQSVKSKGQDLITVIGCGGDRDKGKRPEMAKAAVRYSSKVVLTSDNPRTEDPEVILDMMEAGIPEEMKAKVLRISDRRSAIKTAVMLAQKGDIILVAGKGHENYQEINGKKHDFNDKIELKKALQNAQ